VITTAPTLFALGFSAQGDFGPVTCYRDRRRRLILYLRAPPTKPPSYLQARQRAFFRYASREWSALPSAKKTQWQLAAKRASLRITAFNLWLRWRLTGNDAEIATLARFTGAQIP